jgi:hypothetical protein
MMPIAMKTQAKINGNSDFLDMETMNVKFV